jgi:hypothetical protein
MGGTRIKKNNHELMVDRESTRHYWRTLGEFRESTLALVVRVGCLPLERSSGLGAILNEMGRAATIETTIFVVSLVGWWKARSRALLLLLLGLWYRRSIELMGGLATHLPG